MIEADYREKTAGIIRRLALRDIPVRIKALPCGDYRIGKGIGIERKTAHDFLVSLIDGRLFRQAGIMKNNIERPLFLVEGDVFQTDLDVSGEAVRGALLSLQSIWHIPVIFSASKDDTCRLLQSMLHLEQKSSHLMVPRPGYRPKRLLSKKLFILQGLPHIGPLMAKRLLSHFITVRRVFTASTAELKAVQGIGEKTATAIQKILT